MSPNRRKRAYAKRRYAKWQAKQQQKHAHRQRNRRIAQITGAAVAVAALTTLVVYFVAGVGDEDPAAASPSTDTTATPRSSATPSAAPSATTAASPSASAVPAGADCPAVTVKPRSPAVSFSAPAAPSTAGSRSWTVQLATTCGPVSLSLDGAKAPQATAVMLQLARAGYFDGVPCHRLTTAGIYVLQCGDPTGTGTGGPGFTFGPVENAPADNVYPAGTIAMARQGDNGASMGSQFFLVYQDSTIPADSAGGYTVLGQIEGGLATLQRVAAGGVADGGQDGAPRRAVSITGTSVTPG